MIAVSITCLIGPGHLPRGWSRTRNSCWGRGIARLGGLRHLWHLRNLLWQGSRRYGTVSHQLNYAGNLVNGKTLSREGGNELDSRVVCSKYIGLITGAAWTRYLCRRSGAGLGLCLERQRQRLEVYRRDARLRCWQIRHALLGRHGHGAGLMLMHRAITVRTNGGIVRRSIRRSRDRGRGYQAGITLCGGCILPGDIGQCLHDVGHRSRLLRRCRLAPGAKKRH